MIFYITKKSSLAILTGQYGLPSYSDKGRSLNSLGNPYFNSQKAFRKPYYLVVKIEGPKPLS